MPLDRKVVVDKRTNRVVSHGFVDFSTLPEYPSFLYLIITSNFVFDPELNKQNWYWDGTTFTTEVQ